MSLKNRKLRKKNDDGIDGRVWNLVTRQIEREQLSLTGSVFFGKLRVTYLP